MRPIKHIYLLSLILLPGLVSAQFLENPSFEGPPGIGLTPSGWSPFDSEATPDTEPLVCDDFQAAEGETCITLVSHGSDSPQHGINENCQADLLQPLMSGICYSLSMDLISREDLGHYDLDSGFIYYREQAQLLIYGSRQRSSKGLLLYESEVIGSTVWSKHSFVIKPDASINYLTLEISSSPQATGNGNLLVDNIIISSHFESRVVLDSSFTSMDLPIELSASESSSYKWTPGTGLSCYDCRSPEVVSSVSRTYTCRILEDSLACPQEELFILFFDDEQAELPADFEIPNVFTPNGDGINDLFEIHSLPMGCAIQIYNRSGRELYSNTDYTNNWNGDDMEGLPLPEDNYWYHLSIPGIKKNMKGPLFLKRQ